MTSYHAIRFLSRIEETIIGRGENYIAVKNMDSIRVLVYNYCHYNELYRRFDYSQISPLNRYKIFESGEKITLEFNLSGINYPIQMEEHKVSRKEGSVFDAWVEMGAPDNPSTEAHAFLAGKSRPGYRFYKLPSKSVVEISLDSHEFALIEIKEVLS